MSMSFQLPLASLIVAMLTGCAWVPQKVAITPQFEVLASDAGNGRTVVVQVKDSRSSSHLGYRGLDSKGAEITCDEDLASIVQAKLIEGLAKQGFRAVSTSEQPARLLKVEIRTLEYTTDMDFFKGIVRAKAALQAYSKYEDRIHDQTYLAEREEKTVEAPGAKTNARLINSVLSDAMQRLLTDQRLIKLLTT